MKRLYLKYRRPLLFFGFLLLVIACIREDEPDYPVIITGQITGIDRDGADFHAKINYSKPGKIIDHGFVLNKVRGHKRDENTYSISLGPLVSPEFKYRAETLFLEGVTYYVRAFATTAETTWYGLEREFVSLGGGAPVIEKIEPGIGFPGDTISIHGKNSSFIDDNIVMFDDIPAKIVSHSPFILKVIVPLGLNSATPSVSISVMGNIARAPEPFRIIPPLITGFTPGEGRYNSEVTIYGKYFIPGKTTVYLDTLVAPIRFISDTLLRIVIPNGGINGFMPLSVKVLNQTTVADSAFRKLMVDITSITPTTGTWRDVLKITGYNFSSVASENTVMFNTWKAEVTRAYTDSIFVKVPDWFKGPSCFITVKTNEEQDITPEEFSLLPPVLEQYLPASAYFGQRITIYGKNFHPESGFNSVSFNGEWAVVMSSTPTSIVVEIPPSLETPVAQVKVEIMENKIEFDSPFTLKPPVIISISPTEVAGGHTVTILGRGFSPYYNEVKIGDTSVGNFSNYNGNTTLFNFTTPYDLPTGKYPVTVTTAQLTAVSPQLLSYYNPFRLLDKSSPASPYSLQFVINGRYFMGGTGGKFWEFFPETNTFLHRHNMPEASVSKDGTRSSAFTTASYCYYMKGAKLYRYDPQTDTWEQRVTLPGQVNVPPIAFTIGTTGYVVGGNITLVDANNRSYIARRVYKYLEEENQWLQVASIPTSKGFQDGISFTYQGKGYVGLGFGEYGEMARIWEYDPDLNTWKVVADLTGKFNSGYKTLYQCSAFLVGDELYMVGGILKNADGREDIDIYAYRYNMKLKTFSTLLGFYKNYYGGFHFVFPHGIIIGGGSNHFDNYRLMLFDPTQLPPSMIVDN